MIKSLPNSKGVGRKFNEQWAGNVSVGWDTGEVTLYQHSGPTEGYWNVGLGLTV